MENGVEQFVVQLKALADPARLRMVMLCAQGECSVSELTRILGLSQPRVSQHLSLLRLHRIVAERREGRHHYYHLVQPDFAAWIIHGLDYVEGRMTGISESEIDSARALWSAQMS